MVLFTIRYSVTMKKSLVGLLSALLLILAPTAQGQVKNQEIQGSVVEFGVEAAVPNAVISLASGGKVLATTDAQGRFRITGLREPTCASGPLDTPTWSLRLAMECA